MNNTIRNAILHSVIEKRAASNGKEYAMRLAQLVKEKGSLEAGIKAYNAERTKKLTEVKKHTEKTASALEKQAARSSAIKAILRSLSSGSYRQAAGRLHAIKLDTSKWHKLDPRRLFTTTRSKNIDIRNVTPGAGFSTVGGSGAPGYGAIDDTVKHIKGTRDTTYLSPGKVLAGVGLGAFGASTLGSGDADGSTHSPTTSDRLSDGTKKLQEFAKRNPRAAAALAAAGLLTVGGVGGYMLAD